MTPKKSNPVKPSTASAERPLPDMNSRKADRKPKKPEQEKPSELRKRAEEKLKSIIIRPEAMSDKETRQLVHELQVHQIELEMQNEELRKSQSELEESRSKYSDLYDFAPVGYFTFDKNGLTLEANLTATKELGVERAFIINKPFRAYIIAGDRNKFDQHLRDALTSEDRKTCELRLKRKNRIEFIAQLESIALLDSGGADLCRTSCIDITSRKQTERALLDALATSVQRHAEISALLEGSKAISRYRNFMDAAESIFNSCKNVVGAASGYIAMVSHDGTKNEVVFLDSGGLICSVDPGLPMPIRGMRGEVFSSGNAIYHNDFPQSGWAHFLPEGHVQLENVLMAPMIIENKVVGLFGLGNKPGGFTENDVRITSAFSEFAAIALSQKKAEEDLHKSEARYRSYIDVTEQLGWTTNADGEVVEDLPSWRKFTGQSEVEVKGWGWSKALHPDDLDHAVRVWENAVATKKRYEVEYRIRRYDGIYRHFLARGVPVFKNDRIIQEWVGTCIDITDRKLMEKSLQDTAHSLGERVKELNCLYGISNLASHKNITLEEILQGVINLIPPAWQYPDITCARIVLEGREFRTKNFQETAWRQSSAIIVHNKRAGMVEVCYLKTRPASDEGTFLKEERNLIDAIAERVGRITERKQAEEETNRLTDELKRSNDDLQQFAYAASHDLQEPLLGIAGFAKLLEKRYKGRLDEKADEFIDYIIDDTKRMQLLIKDLLEYSRVSARGIVFRPTNCSVALERAIYNLRTAIDESGAEVTYDLLPTVMGDEAQLSRLFQNLIGNAIKFCGQEPLKIQISADRKEDEWIFSIRDTGIGIEIEQAERIFVIFQRLHTRAEYSGTGIGLAICKKIIESHGGRIWVESSLGKGSTFYFTIPDRQEPLL